MKNNEVNDYLELQWDKIRKKCNLGIILDDLNYFSNFFLKGTVSKKPAE